MQRLSIAVLTAGFFACFFALSHSASAQDYPNRPIMLVILFPPGGGTSIVGRAVRKRLVTDGADPTPGSPADYANLIHKDEKRWSAVVKASGAKGE